MPNPQPTVVFDFINKVVVTSGTSPEADRQYQAVVAQQQQQGSAQGSPPAA